MKTPKKQRIFLSTIILLYFYSQGARSKGEAAKNKAIQSSSEQIVGYFAMDRKSIFSSEITTNDHKGAKNHMAAILV